MTHEPAKPQPGSGDGVVVESVAGFWRVVARSLTDPEGRVLLFRGPGAFAGAGVVVAWMWAEVGSDDSVRVFWIGAPPC